MSNPKSTKDLSVEEILELRRRNKARKEGNKTKNFWQLSMLCFIVMLIIHFSVVKIDSGTIEFGEGNHQRKSVYFHAPENTPVILKTEVIIHNKMKLFYILIFLDHQKN